MMIDLSDSEVEMNGSVEHETATASSSPGTRQIIQSAVDQAMSSPASKQKEIQQGFLKLLQSNYTRDITIVVDVGTGVGPDRFRYIPARAKMDTGCDEDMVSLDLLLRAGIKQEDLKPIDEETGIEFVSVQGLTAKPEHEIELTWYQDKSMKIRVSRFYVMREAPFDLLLKSTRLSQEIRSPSLILAGRRKNKGISCRLILYQILEVKPILK